MDMGPSTGGGRSRYCRLLCPLQWNAGRRGAAGADNSSKGQLVAEKCFTLSEISVADIKDSGDLTNSIKVKRGKKTHVYRTNHPEDKGALWMAFRQVDEEMQAKKRELNEKEQERRKSMWTGEVTTSRGQGAVSRVPGILAALAAADGMPTDSSSINSFEDDLAMAIALRDWPPSVELVIKVSDDLSNPDVRKSEVIDLTSFLTRLGEAQASREAFLRARKELLGRRTRMIGYHGDVPTYISELAIVTFTILKHTSDWYLAALQDNNMVSGFVDWCQVEVEEFVKSFRRQVYGPSEDPFVIRDSLQVVASDNRKLMREAGLDFTFLLSTLLQPDWDSPDVRPNEIIRDAAVRPRKKSERKSKAKEGEIAHQ
ncbi:hypothetical protein QFC21_007155 [Naganishia friedmannii]|uniref:Uncharacterized protein n=1 Tax=Naganishia friedmannii TaxID=89922 RepID=A0ACC2UX14_9TREE|nr:hypothetical protein QFC21_007155 [Naganishia friedmannii]